jgi:hypothetical protein
MTSDDDSADSAPTSAGMDPNDETNLLPPATQATPVRLVKRGARDWTVAPVVAPDVGPSTPPQDERE